MPKRRKLTPVEWDLMDAVWALGRPASVREVLERAYPRGEKAYTTVQTLLNTLERKKLLRRKKIGLVNFYAATRSREEVVRSEMDSVLARMFGGSVPALASTLLARDDLSLEEIAEIKKLLRRRERELRGEGT